MDPKAKPKREDPFSRPMIYLPGLSNVASSMECTGLMPALPRTEEEAEALRALSDLEIPSGQDGP